MGKRSLDPLGEVSLQLDLAGGPVDGHHSSPVAPPVGHEQAT